MMKGSRQLPKLAALADRCPLRFRYPVGQYMKLMARNCGGQQVQMRCKEEKPEYPVAYDEMPAALNAALEVGDLDGLWE